MRPKPRLIDTHHRVLFGGPNGNREDQLLAIGATSILHLNETNSPFLGVYVDDSTPDRNNVARQLVNFLQPSRSPSGLLTPLVVVSLATEENPHFRIPGCTMAWEYYPYPRGWPPTVLARGLDAYIVQWNFGFPGCKPPSLLHRWRLLQQVKKQHPKLIFLY